VLLDIGLDQDVLAVVRVLREQIVMRHRVSPRCR
jgi:hypothetical protein